MERSFARWLTVLTLLSVVGLSVSAPITRAAGIGYRFSTARTFCGAVATCSGVYLGVWQPGVPQSMGPLTTFEQDAGRHVAIVMFWRDWAGTASTLDPAWLTAIAQHGSLPMITWSPQDWDTGESFTLTDIINGKYDAYITGWAQQLKQYGGPVLLRTMHEMNGTWFASWSGDPKQYVAAWRHIHQIFETVGAANVQWVWCPSVFWKGSTAVDPKAYYPGDKYVDWIGLAGYNFSRRGWMSFERIFGNAYHVLSKRSKKPMLIAELGTGEATARQAAQGRSKAKWIKNALTKDIPRMPRVHAIIWFNEDKTGESSKGQDWRIESSPTARKAFAAAVRSPLYRTFA